jgi:hypothetical protein
MPPFRLLHVPPRLVATAFTFGCKMPFWNADGVIREFALLERIAVSQLARVCFIISGVQISALEMAMWIFYLQGKLTAVDTILILMWYAGVGGWGMFASGKVCRQKPFLVR